MTDWKLVVFMVVIFGIMSLLLFKIIKPKMADLGAKNQTIQSRIAKWRIQAIYGIKDVKVLHREAFFADNHPAFLDHYDIHDHKIKSSHFSEKDFVLEPFNKYEPIFTFKNAEILPRGF